ncbi:DUF5046 domain-containing protein, partial [Marivivens sp.]|uniref:DUF5046 domain-containing protein n=1 Tax=Marivivens sp. TaxID=1978374 RepID=UPI00345BC783
MRKECSGGPSRAWSSQHKYPLFVFSTYIQQQSGSGSLYKLSIAQVVASLWRLLTMNMDFALDRLDEYLSSDDSPDDCFMLSDLDGFLHGIA